MSILVTLLTVLLGILSVGLILIVVVQTPKSDGFTGGVANAQGGGFRGKAGQDEILSGYTRFVAIAWFATAFILAVVSEYTKA